MKSTRAVRILGAVTVTILLGWVMILCPLSADAEPVVSGPAVVAVQQDSRITVDENALDHRRYPDTLCSYRRVGRWTKWWCVWLRCPGREAGPVPSSPGAALRFRHPEGGA